MESQRNALGLFVALGGMWLFVGMAMAWVSKRFGLSLLQALVSGNLIVLVGMALLWQTLVHAFASDAAVAYFSILLVFTTSAGIVGGWLETILD